MKRQFKKIIIVAASLATVASSVTPAAACGGRGGGYGGFGGGFVRSNVVQRSAVYAPCSQPVYQQPQVYKPAPIITPQPTAVINQSRPVQGIARNPQATLPSQASIATPAVQQPTTSAVVPASNRLTSAASNNAVKTPVADSTISAETSALKMLQALGSTPQPTTSSAATTIPEFTAAAKKTAEAHVGTWKVNLPNSQSVELVLQADGKFIWTAVGKGNQKTFGGQYRMDDGRLTLVRSSDLQQMSGSWTGSENQFTFKLDGANNGGLSFQRS